MSRRFHPASLLLILLIGLASPPLFARGLDRATAERIIPNAAACVEKPAALFYHQETGGRFTDTPEGRAAACAILSLLAMEPGVSESTPFLKDSLDRCFRPAPPEGEGIWLVFYALPASLRAPYEKTPPPPEIVTHFSGQKGEEARQMLVKMAKEVRNPPPVRVLLTGFEPFGGNPVNPSILTVDSLDPVSYSKRCLFLHTLLLPVVYGESRTILLKEIERFKPHLLISLGMAAGEKTLRIEQVGENGANPAYPDNAGKNLKGPIDPAAPATLETGVPMAALLAALGQDGFAAHVSRNAGGYLCNYVYFVGLNACRTGVCWSLFLHVPGEADGATLARNKGALEVVIAFLAERWRSGAESNKRE